MTTVNGLLTKGFDGYAIAGGSKIQLSLKSIAKAYSFRSASNGPRRIVELRPPRSIPFKVFQIGFNKCGTKTLHHYFRRNGWRSVHWDKGRLAQRVFANLASGNKLLEGYEEFDVFTDMEFLDDFGTYFEAYKLFPRLAAEYPHAKFILNTRDREAWILSRLAHGKEFSYARRAMVHHNVTSLKDLTNLWRTEWEQHHRRVIEFFGDQPSRLIICQIETDLPHILDKALPEYKLDSRYYRVKGKQKLSRDQLDIIG
jgi:hypothetical protein